MKKSILYKYSLLLLTVFCTTAFTQAQEYWGDIFLNSQADVNAFSYSTVIGGVNIHGTDIIDLSPLYVSIQLREIYLFIPILI